MTIDNVICYTLNVNNNIRAEGMNEREMMKLAETMEEFSVSDYTVEELRRMRGDTKSYSDYKSNYFDYYDDVKDKTLKRQDW